MNIEMIGDLFLLFSIIGSGILFIYVNVKYEPNKPR